MTSTVAKKRVKRPASGFGESLRRLREGCGLTQGQLGERIGVRYQAIAKYERGATEPTWPVVLDLCRALGVSTEDFRVGPSSSPDGPVVPLPDKPKRKKK